MLALVNPHGQPHLVPTFTSPSGRLVTYPISSILPLTMVPYVAARGAPDKPGLIQNDRATDVDAFSEAVAARLGMPRAAANICRWLHKTGSGALSMA
jgi:hypothetical protein